MADIEKVIKGLEVCTSIADDELCPKDCPYYQEVCYGYDQLMRDALALLKEQQQQIWEFQDQVEYLTDKLKEQEKKEIKLHKKHVLTLKRNDEFTMRKLYESICEKLLDEGEMIITRTDDHEKVEFVFYVAGE